MEKAYRNLGYFFILLIPLTLLAFLKTYFNQFPNSFSESNGTFIHLHAFMASLWIFMLILQPLLIRRKKYKWHRIIGKASYAIFPLLILSFMPQIIMRLRSDVPFVAFFPISDAITLTLFYSLAIYYKNKVAKHMRFMIGAALVFLSPTFGRIFPVFFDLSNYLTQHLIYLTWYVIIIALIFMDKKNGKNYKPYWIILAAFVIHQLTFVYVFWDK